MYELIQLSEHDYYMESPSKVGIVKISDDEVVIIDSGNDKDAGKKVLRHIEEHSWKLKAIYNTHSHADHIGGNKYLQEKTGCKIYVKGIESCFVNYPILEPNVIYGSFPYEELTHKFILAQPSMCEELKEDLLPNGFSMTLLPGHTFDMVGYKTPDGNFFIGDALASKESIAKYGITFLWDVKTYFETLEMLKQTDALHYVPAHTPVYDDISEIADYNIDVTNKIASSVADFCGNGTCFEDILKQAVEAYGINLDAKQFALIGCTLRAYLSYLRYSGKIDFYFENNYMFWKKLI